MRASEEMFAHETPAGFRHFFPNALLVKSCGPEPVVRVRVTVDDDGPMWAWWKAEGDRITFVYPAFILVDMCFPSGSKFAEQLGNGKVVRVRVDVLERL